MSRKTSLTRRDFAGLTLATVAGLALPTGAAYAETIKGLFDDIPVADDVMGDANAPVTLLEYASMTCPHCKTFHEKVLPGIKEKFVDTGKVKYILRPFPFDGDRRGEAAFMMAKCAPNNSYYPMIDALFSTQASWASPKNNPVPELLRLSKLAGMSKSDFEACLGRQDLLNQLIAGRNKAVKDFGVRSTPTIFINDQKFSGDLKLENVVKAIEAAM